MNPYITFFQNGLQNSLTMHMKKIKLNFLFLFVRPIHSNFFCFVNIFFHLLQLMHHSLVDEENHVQLKIQVHGKKNVRIPLLALLPLLQK